MDQTIQDGFNLIEGAEEVKPLRFWTLKPENPVAEMRVKIKRACALPSNKSYLQPVSKCGLGKKQGVKGTFRGMQLDSFWEAAFYIWMVDIRGSTCIRNTKDFFKYTDENGKPAKFYPDFKTPDFGFCEIKGIFRPNDQLKKEATAGMVKFFGPYEMKKILKEVDKYNPRWREEYSQTSSQKIHYGK